MTHLNQFMVVITRIRYCRLCWWRGREGREEEEEEERERGEERERSELRRKRRESWEGAMELREKTLENNGGETLGEGA